MSNVVDLRITRFNANVSTLIRSESIPRNGNIEIEEGGILELICSAAGRPKPEIYWFKNGRPIIPQKSLHNTYITSEGETSILQLKNVNTWNSGSYACRAENINGHIRKWMNLIVKKEDKTKDSSNLANGDGSILKNTTSNLLLCQTNYCQSGACYLDSNRLKCSCFSSKHIKSRPEIINGHVNVSADRIMESKCNQVGCYSFNDQIFTIFETILVCLVTILLFGIMLFLWKNKRRSCWSKTTSSLGKVNLVGTIKVRDVSIDTGTNTIQTYPERLYHIPIDRFVSVSCCSNHHHHGLKSPDNNYQTDPFAKPYFSQSSKYPNPKFKANNLNYTSFYRSVWPDINYEESSLTFDDTQPLNQSRLLYNARRSPRDTISTFSDTGYSNSLKMVTEPIPSSDTPLTPNIYE